MRRAVEYFEQALALAPSYAPALSGLADALTQLTVFGFDTSPAVIERAREAAEAAVRADPLLGEAHASLGRQRLAGGTWDWAGAERHYRRALELSPGYAQAHLWRAQMLMARGRGPEGTAEIQRALELDPFSPVTLWIAGHFLSMTGDHERAIELLRRALDLSSQSSGARLYLCDAYASAGREKEAADTLPGCAASHRAGGAAPRLRGRRLERAARKLSSLRAGAHRRAMRIRDGRSTRAHRRRGGRLPLPPGSGTEGGNAASPAQPGLRALPLGPSLRGVPRSDEPPRVSYSAGGTSGAAGAGDGGTSLDPAGAPSSAFAWKLSRQALRLVGICSVAAARNQ